MQAIYREDSGLCCEIICQNRDSHFSNQKWRERERERGDQENYALKCSNVQSNIAGTLMQRVT